MLVECPHADRCPGCPLIGHPYPDQLARKAQALRSALGDYSALAEVSVPAADGTPNVTDYRVRAKLVVNGEKLGLFARGTHEVVDIPDCRVLRPRVREVARRIRRVLSATSEVSSVDLREADEGVLVTLGAARSGPAVDGIALRVFSEVPGVVSVAVGERAHDAPQVIAAAPRLRHGPGEVPHHLAPDEPFHYASPGAFTQLHAGQAARVYAGVVEHLTASLGTLAGVRVLELYAGSGALSLRFARAGAVVTAVESHAPAARLAERAAREQSLSVSSRTGDAAEVLAELLRANESFDAVVVNPPRRGLSPLVRRLGAALGPRAIVYVSCEPATLARDADDLARHGMRLIGVRPFDMIPLSEAVETLAVFARAAAPAPRVLFEDDALVAVSKSPHEPTTPQGEHEHSLLRRVQELPGCQMAVPVHRLDLGTSGVCLFARSPDRVEGLARALGSGKKEYVALVRGVTRKKGHVVRALKQGRTTRDARTDYARQRIVGGHSLLGVSPEAGRTHQVRRHLSGIGHPVLGDERYGDRASNAYFDHAYGLDRSFLHLERITLTLGGRAFTISDELPADLRAVLRGLEQR